MMPAIRQEVGKRALPTLYLTILLSILHVCNVLAFKVIHVFGFDMALTGFIFPISFFMLLALNDSHGHQETGKIILMMLVGQSILLLLIPVGVRIPSPAGVATTAWYSNLYSGMWRVFISSNLAVGLSYYFVSFFNSRMKVWFLKKRKIFRFLMTTAIAKGILVIASYPINFYGLLPWEHILRICVNTWLFKMIISIPLVLILPALVKLNRLIDRVDIVDFNVSYNPVRLYQLRQAGVNMYE